MGSAGLPAPFSSAGVPGAAFPLGESREKRRRQFVERRKPACRTLRHLCPAIAPAGIEGRNPESPGRRHVIAVIAEQRGLRFLRAEARERGGEMAGIGLAVGEHVAAAQGIEQSEKAEMAEQSLARRPRLVGAERKPHPLPPQRAERLLRSRKRRAALGGGGLVTGTEGGEEAVIESHPARCERPGEQRLETVADEGTDLAGGEGSEARVRQYVIEGSGESGKRVDQGPVEIDEKDGAGLLHDEKSLDREVFDKTEEERLAHFAMNATAVILAAGLGSRMKSGRPKALHPLGGRPLLAHVIATAAAVFDRLVLVLGPELRGREAAFAPHPVVFQEERLGTGDAARRALPLLSPDTLVSVLYADTPLLTAETLTALRRLAEAPETGAALLAMRPPAGLAHAYGRLLLDAAGTVVRIIEAADLEGAERDLPLCNAGGLTARAADLARWLSALRPDNAKGEYYLTDAVALAAAEGRPVRFLEVPAEECHGINTQADLAAAEALLQRRLRSAALAAGVIMPAPETVFLAADTELSPGVSIAPFVVFGPGVRVEAEAEIRSFSHLEGCHVGARAVIGPHARLRPGTVVEREAHVGNFVELKAARLGRRAKANHLAYLGDAEIGEGANIGAGTITCNYDGQAKHRTLIGAHAFIGSDTALVAPVRIGAGAIIGAGSVITEDVAPDALAIARGRQVEKPGRARLLRARRSRSAGESAGVPEENEKTREKERRKETAPVTGSGEE